MSTDKKSRFDYLLMKNGDPREALYPGGDVGTKAVGFPIGMIMMWEKNISSIPSGWALCDGQEYKNSDGTTRIKTPDLRGLFVIGPNSEATSAGVDSSIRPYPDPKEDGTYTEAINDPYYINPIHNHTATYRLKAYANAYPFTADLETWNKTITDTTGQEIGAAKLRVRPKNICLHYIMRIY